MKEKSTNFWKMLRVFTSLWNMSTSRVMKIAIWCRTTQNTKLWLTHYSSYAWLITFAWNPIYWHCRKQTCVAALTTEAKFISAAVASKELSWIIWMLEDSYMEVKKPTSMYTDNQSCIKLISNEKYSARAKHSCYNIIKDLKSKEFST